MSEMSGGPCTGYILATVVDIEKFMQEAVAAKVEWVFLIPEGGEGEDRVRFFIRAGFTPTEILDEKRLIMARWN